MKRNLTILFVMFFITLTAKGQEVFFIGENSYPSTDTFILKPDSDKYYINDFNVVFGKDGNLAIIAVSTETLDVFLRGKLIIYLNDGSVISLTDKGINEYVNKVASSVYYLANQDLEKMTNSNINKIRYSLENEYGSTGTFGGNFSASNKSKIDFTDIVSKFFKK